MEVTVLETLSERQSVWPKPVEATDMMEHV